MAQFIQLPSLLWSCCFCIFIFILFALHFWALAKICIFNSLPRVLHVSCVWLSPAREGERKVWFCYKHCVLKLTCALIVMNVRRLRSLVDGFVTCGKQRIMNLSSRLSVSHSLVCIFGIQIQMLKSEWAMPRRNLKLAQSIAWVLSPAGIASPFALYSSPHSLFSAVLKSNGLVSASKLGTFCLLLAKDMDFSSPFSNRIQTNRIVWH